MLNKYVVETSSTQALASKPLLLDANFVIDSIIFRQEAVELIAELRNLDCDLITTRSVIVETLGGTKNEDDLRAKINHLELLFAKPIGRIVGLPIERDLPPVNETLAYSRQCAKFSSVDFELYLTLKKYRRSSLTLVTRNHSDFTSKLFERRGFITLLGDKEIRTYGLYTVK